MLAGVIEKLGEEATDANAHIEAMRAEFESTSRTMQQVRDRVKQELQGMRLEYLARKHQITIKDTATRSNRAHWCFTMGSSA